MTFQLKIFCVCVYIHIYMLVIPPPHFSLSLYTYNSDLASAAYCMPALRQPPSIDDRHWQVSEVVHELTLGTLSHSEICQVLKIAHTLLYTERADHYLRLDVIV